LSKPLGKYIILLTAIVMSVMALNACSSTVATKPSASGSTNLTGAGATFPAPLYTKWFDQYNKLTGVKVNYQPIGSGGGISQVTEGTVDFGASDGIMTAEQISKAESKHGPILQVLAAAN
jgi:phosphate transport system substrate-binding protein